jgi:hypothetical protein
MNRFELGVAVIRTSDVYIGFIDFRPLTNQKELIERVDFCDYLRSNIMSLLVENKIKVVFDVTQSNKNIFYKQRFCLLKDLNISSTKGFDDLSLYAELSTFGINHPIKRGDILVDSKGHIVAFTKAKNIAPNFISIPTFFRVWETTSAKPKRIR